MTSGAPPGEPDENIGRVLGQKYELIRLLGKGGMGAVYEGRNQIGKRVAVKLLLKPAFAENKELTARFFREAQAAAAAESKHVVDVYDTGVDADTGFPFIIMAYLNGEDLEHVVGRLGALNPTAAVRIISQAASGLAKAHAAGIVHRDIKPANLFLMMDEGEATVKVLDFGIAKVSLEAALGGGAGEGQALTHTGALLGTPLYMSPEQAQGLRTVDARTDIWSLGMCLYEALAGRLPFVDVDTIGKLIVAIVAQDVRPLSVVAPWVNADLAAIVHRALARDVAARMPTARDLITALRPFTNGSLAVTQATLVGVHGALDATVAPGAALPNRSAATVIDAVSPPAPSTPSTPSAPSGQSGPLVPSSAASPVRALPAAATTGGVSSEARESPSKPRSSSSKLLPLAAAGVALAVAGAAVVAKVVVPRQTVQSAPSGSPLVASAPALPAPVAVPAAPAAADETKVGFLTLKIPDGYTVKVDGVSPGASGNEAAPHAVQNGRLELRGEFQRKFLVAVHDKSGKRVMMQDVYLYDNKLDPEVIDSSTGPVKVDKPKPVPKTGASPAAAPAQPNPVGASPAPAGTDALPARF